jgi:hypothetical protein
MQIYSYSALPATLETSDTGQRGGFEGRAGETRLAQVGPVKSALLQLAPLKRASFNLANGK